VRHFGGKLPAALAIAASLACASALRVDESVAVGHSESASALSADAVADLASHDDPLIPSSVHARVTPDSSDGLRTIERGTYAGMRVLVRMQIALGAGRRSEHFWRIPGSDSRGAGAVGWRSTRYPIPVAFRHSDASGGISESDSAAFWKTLREMSADVGITLFKPATVGDADPVDVIVVDVRPMPGNEGFTRASWSASGEIFDVRVSFGGRDALSDSHIVAHEMTHALGFGHTRSWRSIVNPGDRSAARLTPTDVAYIELAMLLREWRERIDMRRSISVALERETPAASRRRDEVACSPEESDFFSGDAELRNRSTAPISVLTVMSDCAPANRQD
jgi:hypothetical protein